MPGALPRHDGDGSGAVLKLKHYYRLAYERLVYIVESDHSGALAEDAVTLEWFEIPKREVYKWIEVIPEGGIGDV